MRKNDLHQIIISEEDMVTVAYSGQMPHDIVVEDFSWVTQFNSATDEFELDEQIAYQKESQLCADEFVRRNVSNWHIPDKYSHMDIEQWLLDKCSTKQETDRVKAEIIEFETRKMLPVLKWLVYFVDTLRENNQVWGVGRGSSVASFVLYLIGIHKVNSIEYDLDLKEFLK